jgi:hypothetical protein
MAHQRNRMRIPPLRIATWVLAIVHTFPARAHAAAFFEKPSLADAWKGFGGILAVGLYLLPIGVQARALTVLWRKHRSLLRAAALVLVLVHAVPAFDHLPRWLASGSWGDAWRGLGGSLAVAWFLAPLSMQARAVRALAHAARGGRLALNVARGDQRRQHGPCLPRRDGVLWSENRVPAKREADGSTDEAPRPAENALLEKEKRPRPAAQGVRSQTEGIRSATERVGRATEGVGRATEGVGRATEGD